MASPAFNHSRVVPSHQRRVLRTRARRMRLEPTHTEWLLWNALRRKQLGVRFRRQVVLQGYIVDFYASSRRLIVEVDGSSHNIRQKADARRERRLRAAGYQVLHVSAEQVTANLAAVVARIEESLGAP